MKAVLQIAELLLIIMAPIGVAIARKPWQRAGLMICLLFAIFAIFADLSEYQEATINRVFLHDTILPLQKFWEDLEKTLAEGRTADAIHDVKFMEQRWQHIESYNRTNSAFVLLYDLKKSK